VFSSEILTACRTPTQLNLLREYLSRVLFWFASAGVGAGWAGPADGASTSVGGAGVTSASGAGGRGVRSGNAGVSVSNSASGAPGSKPNAWGTSNKPHVVPVRPSQYGGFAAHAKDFPQLKKTDDDGADAAEGSSGAAAPPGGDAPENSSTSANVAPNGAPAQGGAPDGVASTLRWCF